MIEYINNERNLTAEIARERYCFLRGRNIFIFSFFELGDGIEFPPGL